MDTQVLCDDGSLEFEALQKPRDCIHVIALRMQPQVTKFSGW
jgi:hypothetical protein